MNYYRIEFGDEERYALGDTISATPEWIAHMLETTERPKEYVEGQVTVELKMGDLASLFGGVKVAAVSKEEWHEKVSATKV